MQQSIPKPTKYPSTIDHTLLTAILAAIILGFSKAGFKGISFLTVTLMALAYGGKVSTGILLPMLIFADIFAILYYRKDVNWRILFRLFPAMAVGIVIGTFVGKELSLEVFKQVMAGIIFLSGIMILLMGRINTDKISKHPVFAIVMGLSAGFCTMVGNLAGAFANIYFLAMQLPKRAFIGTAAWLFFFVNIFKLPFHIFVWQTITPSTFLQNLHLFPFILVGFGIGVKLIEKFSDAFYKQYIIFMTLLGAVLILLK
ncbi:MAG: sulfite exporter TauE/SafE family protein [Chitinophagales bacterium]